MKHNEDKKELQSDMKRTEIIRIIKNIGLVIVLALSGVSQVNGQTTLQLADSAYQAQNFRQALSMYEKVLNTNGASSELYYNIGNANYRLGNYGKAIVAYERALRLNPANKEARSNLNFVRSSLRGLPEDGSSFLNNVHQSIVSIATANAWSIVALVFFLMLLSCVAFYLFSNNVTLRKAGFFGGICVFVVFIYSFVIAWQTATAQSRDNVGIIVRQNARLTSNPGTVKNKTEKTISIPEGSKVEIMDSLSTPNDPVTSMWYNVRLNNKSEAWIDASDIERI